jgi:hypothetical protein
MDIFNQMVEYVYNSQSRDAAAFLRHAAVASIKKIIINQ